MTELDSVKQRILQMQKAMPAEKSLLAGISGIDACGKGYISARLAEILSTNLNVALINVDGWLNLPEVRFSDNEPDKHFYENALRLDDMFRDLVLPLKRDRRVDLTADQVNETSTAFHKHRFAYENIDIILLEGIFLFKRSYVEHFDLRVWIECSFETALNQGINRSQEGLGRQQTIDAYENIYFPAQCLHFAIDDPLAAADLLYDNN